jgi:hypothetical protein
MRCSAARFERFALSVRRWARSGFRPHLWSQEFPMSRPVESGPLAPAELTPWVSRRAPLRLAPRAHLHNVCLETPEARTSCDLLRFGVQSGVQSERLDPGLRATRVPSNATNAACDTQRTGKLAAGAGRSQVQILSPRSTEYDGKPAKSHSPTPRYSPDSGIGEQFSAGERGTERLASRLACPLSESAMSCRDASGGWAGSDRGPVDPL